MPVFAHLEGICHVYIDRSADLDMAVTIAVNAKMRRTGICGAAETLLVDRAVAATHLVPILEALREGRLRDPRRRRGRRPLFPAPMPATEADWTTEYLDAIISVKLVDGVDGAIEHIETLFARTTPRRSSPRTSRPSNASSTRSIRRSCSHNASTQFADGGEFGMGAEIGIATGKMHARGPVGVEQLTSFKYRVRGTGQTPALDAIISTLPSAASAPAPFQHAACREGHGGRAVRRLVQSAACRSCAGRRDRAATAGARPALVDGDAGQSAEKRARTGAAGRTARALGSHDARSAHQGHGLRGRASVCATPPTRWRW